MHITDSRSPDVTLEHNDAGDDTQKRFRYQASCAASLALGIYQGNEFDVLYCELHGDILLRQGDDGGFVSVQVKTRRDGLIPLRATDAEILSALQHFIELDREFPRAFARFTVITNGGFWSVRRNEHNLPVMLAYAHEHLDNPSLRKLVTKLCSIAAEPEKPVLDVLSRTTATELPSFESIESDLVSQLSVMHPGVAFEDLQQCANKLIDRFCAAAALESSVVKKLHRAVSANPIRELQKDMLSTKRFSRQDIVHLVLANLDNPQLLAGSHALPELPNAPRMMVLKMRAGGISEDNINLAKDHKYMAEHRLLSLAKKHGSELAQNVYSHCSAMAQTACQEAYDVASQGSRPFGQTMLIDLRDRLKTRILQPGALVYGFQYEELFGVVGMLTEECTVWWSECRDIIGESQ